ncbi:hypothetical protein CAC42_3943 [Sphaceloma murrayae]|uniref:Fanconi-associated nuclease n=1 Tax=Sphaceloma murrayae TaxID=2082308 RepID=A0A2K1QSC7_9PEZI|nr:hypothetical protein CAC42_3943 [Sphaceloma murrayae]
MLRYSSPSKHNAMVGQKIAHPPSTNFAAADDFEKRPVKRMKRSPPDEEDVQQLSPRKQRPSTHDGDRTVPDSDTEPDGEDLLAPPPPERKTDLETALPPIRTDKEAIAEYEATRAAELVEELGDAEGRLKARKWIRGKSSIYVDAFNLALDTVLEDESHLFNAAEIKVFDDWKALNYEAQYLYVRLFLRKTSTWHRINKLGYYSDIADMESAIKELQISRSLPVTADEAHEAPGEWEPPRDTVVEGSFTFADRSEDCITTLEEASSLLLLDELKALAKDAKVQGKNKSELLRALRKTSGKQAGLGFLKRSDTEESVTSVDSRGDSDSGRSTPQRENRDTHFLNKIMAETGPCIRLSLPVLKLFERVHLVFYRSTEWTEKSLTTIILARISRWNFPSYLVSRSANIFPSRPILLEFEASVRTQYRVDNILEFNGTPTSDTLQTVLDIFEEVFPRWRVLLAEEQRKEDSIYATGEGFYLRRLSPAWVYTRIVHKGAFVLGKFKHHAREHETLCTLLAQKLFHTSRRGDWYQRKALLEEHYMAALNPNEGRDPEAQKKHWKRIALATCEDGLQDPLTHLIFHHDLQKRITKLEKSLKVPKRSQHDFGHVRLAKPQERTFYGIQIVRPHRRSSNPAPVVDGDKSTPAIPTRRGAKTLWVDPALSPEVAKKSSPVSVEQMCLSHYRRLGWRGYHCESALLRTLFGAIMYDVLFTYVPNVFQTAYQTCPLDLHTDGFYATRIREVEERLREVANGDAGNVVSRFYKAHGETRTCVVGVDWGFDEAEVRAIAACWAPEALATVLKVLAQEYGSRGGGVPDLFLWREFEEGSLRCVSGGGGPAKMEGGGEGVGDMDDKGLIEEELDWAEKKRRRALLDSGQKGEIMFAEVKSENDRLSDTQRMWIDVLTGAGVRVELTHALASEVRVEEK